MYLLLILSIVAVFVASKMSAKTTGGKNAHNYNRYILRSVVEFEQIPVRLIDSIDLMSIHDSIMLNQSECNYLSFVFNLQPENGLYGKRIYFLKSRKAFWNDELGRYKHGLNNGVSAMCLYYFNESQREKSGGYDIAIDYWNKFVLPNKKVVRIIKRRAIRHN